MSNKRVCVELLGGRKASRLVIHLLHRPQARNRDAIDIRPVANASRISDVPSHADPETLSWTGAIEEEDLIPSWGCDVRAWWRGDGAGCAAGCTGAGDVKEDGALAHGVAVSRGDGGHHGDADGAEVAGGDVGGDLNALRVGVGPIFLVEGVGWWSLTVQSVGWTKDLDSVFFGVLAVFRVGAADEDSSVGHKGGFGVVHACYACGGHDGHTLVERLAWVVEDCLQVGEVGETETCDTLEGTVDDEVGSVRKSTHAREDTRSWHTLDSEFWLGDGWLNRDTVINGFTDSHGGSTANHEFGRLSVGWEQWEHNASTFKRVCSASQSVVDGAGNEREDLGGVQGSLIKDTTFVVVHDEDTSRWKDPHEWVQIVGICALKPIHVLRVTSCWERKNLNRGRRSTIGTNFTTDNEDGAVGQIDSRRVPAPIKKRDLGLVLLPVIDTRNTIRTVWGIETNTIGGATRPSTNVELSTSLIWKSDTGSAEDIGLHVKFSPRSVWVVDKVQIEFVGTRSVWCASSSLLHENNLVIDAKSCDQRNHNTTDKEFVFSCVVASWCVPYVEWLSRPSVVDIAIASSADLLWISRASRWTFRIGA